MEGRQKAYEKAKSKNPFSVSQPHQIRTLAKIDSGVTLKRPLWEARVLHLFMYWYYGKKLIKY
jgi:hypothetical protein